ncbi:toxin-antitoxin system YwqK family antitoxin [Roseivirga sp.]|uniref:toxin-antitoxin system YwqK family antitoxin n=1 Tax=Roseivirga sp. TaxID=1964215 RepID=UPI003B8C8578
MFIALIGSFATAQTKKQKKKKSKEETEKPNIRFEKGIVDTIPDAELKKKRNFYFGERTRKAFTRIDGQTNTTFEIFNVLREPAKVDSYVRKIYYHDAKKGQIITKEGRGQTLNRLLHGPYKKTVDDIVVAEGMYFYGAKHGTWLYQKRDSSLYAKEHFHKGWFKDSKITYYDEDRKTKIKEVIPYQYGKKEGEYYLFFESGNVAVRGNYVFDKKVGLWDEFHNLPGVVRYKKQIQYPEQFYLKNVKPYVKIEWNRNSTVVYRSDDQNQ